MKNYQKTLVLLACAVLLVVGSVFGTFAYLTDTEAVTNTFTVGRVGLNLDEADVKLDGTYETNHNSRVKANAYHLLPGHTYQKDPTVTVDAGSEESYVRMKVTFSFSSQLDAIFDEEGADLTEIFNGYDENNWAFHSVVEDTDANTRTYEFRYVGVENKGTKEGTVRKIAETEDPVVLDDLFESFTVPGFLTNDQLATLVIKDNNGKITDQFKITVVAHAIQADGFDTADKAWTAFDAQHNTTND